jgi:[acyl-carrier-protein] S-malonyltransferase
MAKQLCQEYKASVEKFNVASAILGYDLLDVCTNGPKNKLDNTVDYVSETAVLLTYIIRM